MAPPKKPAPKPKPRAKAPPPAPKKIQAVEWYDFTPANRYLMSLFGQMGKLGLAGLGEDGHSLAPFHRDVLSEIMRWRDEHPNEAYDHLVNWRNLNVERIVQRQEMLPRHETAKPRIEITVDVNRKDNLIVRWYPAGFFERRPRYTRGRRYTPNLLDDCDFDDEPDYQWFIGDETGSWAPRPSNELMFIRGVGNLRLWNEDSHWGPHYRATAVSTLLIYAVRASFNAMVEGLRRTHEVTLLDDFAFEFDEVDVPHAPIPLMAKRNVLRSWKIVETPRPQKPGKPIPPPGETGQVLPFRAPSEPSD